ncbi:MAG: CDP-diacylglycerol--glycerol-3-phosphate 3-phosphatidyltransferase [Corallincola sp.]|nr:CDP-diacylglycerol--glycerol-3-phosphate 3-phosphatidyltransferase [Corallincola sp.]
MHTLPNYLTLLRLLLIPVVVVMFLLPWQWSNWAATIAFALAGFTDYLDGYLARKLQQTTAFGAFIDPVADKITVAVALVILIHHYQNLLVTLPAMVIISREILVSALREWMAELGERAKVAVSRIGKWKTTFQMLAIGGLLWQVHPAVTQLAIALLLLAALLTLWSMVSYLRAAWPILKR